MRIRVNPWLENCLLVFLDSVAIGVFSGLSAMVTPEQRWLETWKKAGPELERIRQAELKALPATLPPAFCSEPENPFLNAAVRLRQKLMRIHLRQLQQELQAAREEVARLQAELDKVRGEFGTPARST